MQQTMNNSLLFGLQNVFLHLFRGYEDVISRGYGRTFLPGSKKVPRDGLCDWCKS